MRAHAAGNCIGILGHVGNHNLGDEAIIAAVVQNIRRRSPDARIYAFTRNPEDTWRRHHVPAFPIRRPSRSPQPPGRPSHDRGEGSESPERSGLREWIKTRLRLVPAAYALAKGVRDAARALWELPGELRFARQCYLILRDVDLLIVAGSAQLNDYWAGPWGHPFTLFEWAVLARAAGVPVAFLSLGALPLRTRLARFFVRRALALASYRSYRDESSRDYIAQLGLNGADPVVPDLAFSLHMDAPAPVPRPPRAARIVGINPMPWFRGGGYWPESDSHVYGAYVRALAAFADWLIERGYRVSFFPTQLLVDPGAARDICAVMRRDGAVEARIGSFNDLVVATRYHGALISLLLQKPVLAIAYEPKSSHLMAQVGQGEHALDIRNLGLEALQRRFLSLEARREAVREEIRGRLPGLGRALATQYDRIFGLLAGR
jgi:polysaccharide pyruvyl transferase WcaK-like protein